MNRTLVLSALFFLLASCSRSVENTGSLRIQLPSSSSSVNYKVGALSALSWGVSDPTNRSDIACYAVLLKNSKLPAFDCLNAGGTVVTRPSYFGGLYAAGSSIQLNKVPSGPTVVQLVGFAASSSAACKALNATGGPDVSQLSAPIIVSESSIDLKDGVNSLNMGVPFSLSGGTTFNRCMKFLSLPAQGGLQLALGAAHSCLKEGGSIYCWGQGGSGQLGDGAGLPSATAVKVDESLVGGAIWKEVFSGSGTACAINNSNAGYCWGNGAGGQLGDGFNLNRMTPVAVSGGHTWKKLASGLNHTCGLRTDDTVWCWGGNVNGQLGDNTFTDSLTPVQEASLGTFKDIDVGGYTTCGVLSSGTVKCWGYNNLSQVGDGTATNQKVPTAVSVTLDTDFVSVAVGYQHTCALRSPSGEVQCWGDPTDGKRGDNEMTSGASTKGVASVDGFTKIVAGDNHTCGFKGGDVFCWGKNSYGQIGDGTIVYKDVPTNIGSGFDSFAAGTDHTCATKGDGSLWCWGRNQQSQLGDGTTTSASSPISVSP